MTRGIFTFGLLLFFHLSFGQNRSKEAWVDLFNGKDIDDWMVKIHHYEVGDNYGETFRVENKMIRVKYDQYDDAY